MTEAEQRRKDSPLLSDQGVTIIKDTVVSRIASMAAGEVEGVHMGGSASRSAGGLLEGITGSESSTRGVSVEVGSVEAAIDLKVGIDYGKNLLGTVGEVRQKIIERVQGITGLKVTELNVTIADITYPEDGQGDALRGTQTSRAVTAPQVDTRTTPERESHAMEEGETTEVEPDSRTRTEGSSGPVPEEEVRAGGAPVEEEETRGLGVGEEEPSAAEARDEGAPTSEAGETSGAEAPTDETTLTGETGGGTTPATKGEEDRTQEIDRERSSEAEERRAARRRRRRREEQEDG